MTIADWQVRHRIDGLENNRFGNQAKSIVRHRIDGLEKPASYAGGFRLVRHRIDGLENSILR